MNPMDFRCLRLIAVASVAIWSAPVFGQSADTILINGKIVTVDDRFSIAQALAIRGARIVRVGTNEEVASVKGADTRTIDLAGRTAIPGLIDNHAHYMRAAEYWDREVRLDG